MALKINLNGILYQPFHYLKRNPRKIIVLTYKESVNTVSKVDIVEIKISQNKRKTLFTYFHQFGNRVFEMPSLAASSLLFFSYYNNA